MLTILVTNTRASQLHSSGQKLISGDGQKGCFPHGTGLYKQVHKAGFMTVVQ